MNALRREPTWLPRRAGSRAPHPILHLATSTSKLCGQLTVSTMRRISHIRGDLPYKTRHSKSIERDTTALSLTTTAFRNADLVPTLARPQRLSRIAQRHPLCPGIRAATHSRTFHPVSRSLATGSYPWCVSPFDAPDWLGVIPKTNDGPWPCGTYPRRILLALSRRQRPAHRHRIHDPSSAFDRQQGQLTIGRLILDSRYRILTRASRSHWLCGRGPSRTWRIRCASTIWTSHRIPIGRISLLTPMTRFPMYIRPIGNTPNHHPIS